MQGPGGGDHLYALCWMKMIGNVICQQLWCDLRDKTNKQSQKQKLKKYE